MPSIRLDLIHAVQQALSDDLRRPQWQGHVNSLAGHCYVASEALLWLVGGKSQGWAPQTVRVAGVTHWYLRHTDGTILDPTRGQFEGPVPYENGRGRGFLTPNPSKRACVVLARVGGQCMAGLRYKTANVPRGKS